MGPKIDRQKLYNWHCKSLIDAKWQTHCKEYVDQCIERLASGVNRNKSEFCLTSEIGKVTCGMTFNKCVQLAKNFTKAYGQPKSKVKTAPRSGADKKKGSGDKTAPNKKNSPIVPRKSSCKDIVPFPIYLFGYFRDVDKSKRSCQYDTLPGIYFGSGKNCKSIKKVVRGVKRSLRRIFRKYNSEICRRIRLALQVDSKSKNPPKNLGCMMFNKLASGEVMDVILVSPEGCSRLVDAKNLVSQRDKKISRLESLLQRNFGSKLSMLKD